MTGSETFALIYLVKKKNLPRKGRKPENFPSLLFSFFVILAFVVGYIIGYQWNKSTNVVEAQTTNIVPPFAPINLQVYSYLGSSKWCCSKDILTWNPSPNNLSVASYLIYEIIGGNPYLATPIAEVTGTTWTRNFTGNGYATDYSYYVKAKDASGNLSEPSNIAHMTGIWGDLLDNVNHRYLNGSTISATNGTISQTYTATITGSYLINLPPGTYNVTYSAPGYVSQQATLNVVNNQMTSLIIYLSKATKK